MVDLCKRDNLAPGKSMGRCGDGKSGREIDWVNGKPREAVAAYVPWREAVEAADRGKTAVLTKRLRSGAAVVGPQPGSSWPT